MSDDVDVLPLGNEGINYMIEEGTLWIAIPLTDHKKWKDSSVNAKYGKAISRRITTGGAKQIPFDNSILNINCTIYEYKQKK